MTVLLHILLFLHFVAWAVVLGSALVGLRSNTLYAGALHSALTALVTGVAMVLVVELWLDDFHRAQDPTWPAWVAVKLILAVVVTALVWLGSRRPERVGKPLLGAILGLTVLAVAVAAIWR